MGFGALDRRGFLRTVGGVSLAASVTNTKPAAFTA